MGLFRAASRWFDRYPLIRRVAVAAVICVALLFLARSIRAASASRLIAALDGADFVPIGLCGIAYAGLLALLARGWSLAPASQGQSIGWRAAIAVYGLSVLPKYVPGSVLQYGSRQMLGRARGWDGKSMARGSALEVALHLLCSAAIALVLLSIGGMVAPSFSRAQPLFLAAVATVGAAVLTALCARSLPPSVVIRSALCQLAFFVGTAGLAMACAGIFGIDVLGLPMIGGVFLLSWLIGFVVPVAPGGLGVREAAGVALMAPLIGVEHALLIQATMRIVTLTGDILLFVAALWCGRPVPRGAV